MAALTIVAGVFICVAGLYVNIKAIVDAYVSRAAVTRRLDKLANFCIQGNWSYHRAFQLLAYIDDRRLYLISTLTFPHDANLEKLLHLFFWPSEDEVKAFIVRMIEVRLDLCSFCRLRRAFSMSRMHAPVSNALDMSIFQSAYHCIFPMPTRIFPMPTRSRVMSNTIPVCSVRIVVFIARDLPMSIQELQE